MNFIPETLKDELLVADSQNHVGYRQCDIITLLQNLRQGEKTMTHVVKSFLKDDKQDEYVIQLLNPRLQAIGEYPHCCCCGIVATHAFLCLTNGTPTYRIFASTRFSPEEGQNSFMAELCLEKKDGIIICYHCTSVCNELGVDWKQWKSTLQVARRVYLASRVIRNTNRNLEQEFRNADRIRFRMQSMSENIEKASPENQQIMKDRMQADLIELQKLETWIYEVQRMSQQSGTIYTPIKK